MDLKEDLFAAVAPRRETLVLGGIELTIVELNCAVDLAAFSDEKDQSYKMLVRCVFGPDGNSVFTDDDLPRLKGSGLQRLAPLVEAVRRVNGLSEADNEKKSVPQPSASPSG